MKKQFKSKDFGGAAFVVFSSEDKAREFVEKSKETPIKYEDGSVLECSLQDDHYKKKALELATGKKPDDDANEKRANDKQARKDKRKDDMDKKTNEHLEKLNNENLPGALIHLAGTATAGFVGDGGKSAFVLGMAPTATRELIKEKFNPFTKTPWIDFNKGDAEVRFRLSAEDGARKGDLGLGATECGQHSQGGVGEGPGGWTRQTDRCRQGRHRSGRRGR